MSNAPSPFWTTSRNSVKASNKPSFIKTGDIVDLIKSEDTFSTSTWTKIRFIGPTLGINVIPVPIIKEERFFKKEGGKFLIAPPKQSLGYDYRTKKFDETKCPYLKYITLDNPLIAIAVINYIYDNDLPNAEKLVSSIENQGLRKTYFDQNLKKDLLIKKELADLLRPISMKGTEEYYVNILVYNDSYTKLSVDQKKRFTDLELRSSKEREKVDFLDYSDSYGEQVYLCDSLESNLLTPLKVLKMSSKNVEEIINNVGILNTSYDEGTDTEIAYSIEDPENGCSILLQLEKKDFGKISFFMKKFIKDQRRPLTANEKEFMLWNLESLKTQETYEEAFNMLKDLGYTKEEKFASLGNMSSGIKEIETPSNEEDLPWSEEPKVEAKPKASSSKAKVVVEDEEDIF